jgi:hypothetical protein
MGLGSNSLLGSGRGFGGAGHYAPPPSAPPAQRICVTTHIADLTEKAKLLLDQARGINTRIHGAEPEPAESVLLQGKGPAPVRDGLNELNDLLNRVGNILEVIAGAL